MTTWEIIRTVAAIATPVIAVISIILARKSKKPKVDFVGLTIYPERIETYLGKEVEWSAELINEAYPLNGAHLDKSRGTYNYKKTVKEHARELFVFPHIGKTSTYKKDYLFINLCTKNLDIKRVILSFDVLSIALRFAKEDVDTVIIRDAYSMKDEKTSFGNDIKINNLEFSVRDSLFEIPVAYAALDDRDSSLYLKDLNALAYERKKANNYEPINILDEENCYKADKYIAFKETGYLIECRKADRKLCEYSFYIEMKKISEESSKAVVKTQIGRSLYNKKRRATNESVKKRKES